MKHADCGGRLLSKIVRERNKEVYRRRYCARCGAGVTTLEVVIELRPGGKGRVDIEARRIVGQRAWWTA